MASLLECVPNFSEGRRPEVTADIVRAVEAVPGVAVLDHSSDASHNRSVVTFAGATDAVEAAAEEAVRVALDLIDMRVHSGVHPRIGAVDVVPFVPLAETPMDAAVAVARRFAERVATRFDLPAYLYGHAALRPERRRLADVRRGQLEGLSGAIRVDPARNPDFGPHQLHPTAGAVAVGARRALIAFNINLRSGDVALASSIARAIRESSGGMPGVQAMGVPVASPGRSPIAQVSTNITEWRATGIAALVDAVRRLAAAAGTDVDACELIGLAPAAAVEDLDGASIGIPDIRERTIEARLGGTNIS